MQEQEQEQATWDSGRKRKVDRMHDKSYVCYAAEASKDLAIRLQESNPERYRYFPIDWGKFPDGTDDITMDGFYPSNQLAGEHILFFASFNSNDVTLSQFSVFIVLLQSFIESLTIVLPFYPVGTNERVESEGKVATANTYSMLLSSLPTAGRPTRIVLYDLHALQERFYFHGSVIPSLHSSVPLLLDKLKGLKTIKTIAFPDDGAAKRFSSVFKKAGYLDIIICGKVRNGNTRIVTVQEGDPKGKDVVIVDDLIQTGGTMAKCAVALKELGANQVTAFVAHGVFPNESWKNFCKKLNGKYACFDKFWLTNSIPSSTSQLPTDDVFEVLDLLPRIVQDLDSF